LNNDVQAQDLTTLLPFRSVSVAITHPSSLNYVAANTFLVKGDEGHHNGHVTGITLHATVAVEKARFEEQKSCDLRKKMKSKVLTFFSVAQHPHWVRA